jgi:hypothetical protein
MHRSPINPRIMKPVRFGAERIYLDIYTKQDELVYSMMSQESRQLVLFLQDMSQDGRA